MEVGILTFSKSPSYGAMLQCYALCSTVRALGHNPYLIDIGLPHEDTWKYKIRSCLLQRSFKSFQRKCLPPYVSKETHFDCVVIGSDQVWNPTLTKERALDYFGDFVKGGTLLVSYAASFGEMEWRHKHLSERVSALLHRFKAISVREKNAVELCQKEFGVQAKCVIDPVFLLDDYSSMVKEIRDSSYLAAFKLHDPFNVQWKLLLDELGEGLGCDVRNIGVSGMYSTSKPIGDWLTYIANARAVITDSFHCMSMAILFHKPVVVVTSVAGREIRMTNLLSELSLSHLFMGDYTKLEIPEVIRRLEEHIDYESVEIRRSQLKKESLSFLRASLS